MVSKSQAFCMLCSLKFSCNKMFENHNIVVHEKRKDQSVAFVILRPLEEIGYSCIVHTDRNFVDNFLKVVIYLALVANI